MELKMARRRKKYSAYKTSKYVSYKFIAETIAASNEDFVNTINLFNDMYKGITLLNVSEDIKFPVFREIWFSVKLFADLIGKNETIGKMIMVDGKMREDNFDMLKEPIELLHFTNVMNKMIVFNDLANGSRNYILTDIISVCLRALSEIKEKYDETVVEEFKAVISNFAGVTEKEDIENMFKTMVDESDRRRDMFLMMQFKLAKVMAGISAPYQKDITKGVE